MSVLISKNVWLQTKYGQTSLLLKITMRPWTCKLGSRHRLAPSVLLLQSGLQEVSPTALVVILLVGDVGVSNYCAICFSSQLSSYNFLKSLIFSEVLLWDRKTSPENVKEERSSTKTWRAHPEAERAPWCGKIRSHRKLHLWWVGCITAKRWLWPRP